MSIDLDWLQLSTLSNRLVDSLNRLLKTTERPSFIGPITINGFEFGTTPPDVELVDVRDIYPDFLEEDEESDISKSVSGTDEEEEDWNGSQRSPPAHSTAPRRAATGTSTRAGAQPDRKVQQERERKEQEEGFEWVNRRGTGRAVAEMGPTYHPFPPHVRYGGTSSASNILDSTNPLVYSRSWDLPPFTGASAGASHDDEGEADSSEEEHNTRLENPATLNPSMHPTSSAGADADAPAPSGGLNTDNDMQFHLRVIYHSDIRINITTSLLLNYPAPLFMALPIRLTIVGFEFDGEVVVAYQPSRKRMHVCVLDDEDPYRPASLSNSTAGVNVNAGLQGVLQGQAGRQGEKVSPGVRLLPHIFIESEIGQADQQVLRNVGRVERFLQDMVRMTVEQELVFPNFQTVIYGDE